MAENGKVYTTHQIADICNVHYTTVISWINEGKLEAYATPGGHRRVKREELIEFMKKYKIPLPEKISEKKLILIVDDDLEALEEMETALEDGRYDLEFASDGFSAARKIYTDLPDLILLDFKMPGMNGFEVCEVLKKDKETAKIPVIAVTALTSNEDIVKIKKCGVNKYFAKPVDIDKLKNSILQALNIKDKIKVI